MENNFSPIFEKRAINVDYNTRKEASAAPESRFLLKKALGGANTAPPRSHTKPNFSGFKFEKGNSMNSFINPATQPLAPRHNSLVSRSANPPTRRLAPILTDLPLGNPTFEAQRSSRSTSRTRPSFDICDTLFFNVDRTSTITELVQLLLTTLRTHNQSIAHKLSISFRPKDYEVRLADEEELQMEPTQMIASFVGTLKPDDSIEFTMTRKDRDHQHISPLKVCHLDESRYRVQFSILKKESSDDESDEMTVERMGSGLGFGNTTAQGQLLFGNGASGGDTPRGKNGEKCVIM
eukprot:TRINITY_DN1399_c0_g1_i1.p1 TRINITY_DN1399_c0_g1~~TRINITY_DN1399_c0_g1_i1.p1  ORF type:complete len:293 (-),score=69.02 TRINITY_DN1399_c0_g1_i1:1507-2385(-)